MVAHPLQTTHALAAASLLFALLHATEARVIVISHPTPPEICYDDFDNEIPCPQSNLRIIIGASVGVGILLLLIAAWLYRVLRARRSQQSYQPLPAPPTNTSGPQGGGVMIPAAPGQMGYAGPQPQLPYRPGPPPNFTVYARSPFIPQVVVNPALPGHLQPPPPPPAAAAATHYGYSVGPI